MCQTYSLKREIIILIRTEKSEIRVTETTVDPQQHKLKTPLKADCHFHSSPAQELHANTQLALVLHLSDIPLFCIQGPPSNCCTLMQPPT